MGTSDANYWRLTKEIAGLEPPHSASTPPVDCVAEHFQSKISNGREAVDSKPTVIPERVLLKS
jgi:hypothetical protein